MKPEPVRPVSLLPEEIEVAVVGLGLMGRSIAACLLGAGHRVTGITNDIGTREDTIERVREFLEEMRSEGIVQEPAHELLRRFRVSDRYADVASCGIVFESVTEDTELKRGIFREIEAVVPVATIIGTNTSAIPITQLQKDARRPERFVGIHWDEPAHITRFMEIIPGDATGQASIERIAALTPYWNKEASILKRDIRGFITNRISYAMFREACHLVESGACTVEDVDRSLRNDVGWWIPFAGPFRYMDLMGVEAYYRVMRDLLPDLSTGPEIPKLMRQVVESGGRGVSNGRGFYHYTEEEAKLWQEKFEDFNCKIRRLTSEYASLHARPHRESSSNR
jgi:3-hydroxybutyryl-CoA dehydrogenase